MEERKESTKKAEAMNNNALRCSTQLGTSFGFVTDTERMEITRFN